MQENAGMSYKVGNSSPLRTYSPKRGSQGHEAAPNQYAAANTHQQPSSYSNVNLSNVKNERGSTATFEKQTVANPSSSTAYVGGVGGGCAGAPTEKERMIAQLM